MSPRLIKAIAAAVVAAATSLEISQVLPVGSAAFLGGAVTFVLGLIHPAPSK